MAYSIGTECIGCGACAKNCPQDAITGEKKAQHAINPNKCISCGVCGRTCPKAAVHNEAGEAIARVPKSDWLKPVVDSKLCTGCQICIYNCFKECLALSRPQFVGDIHTFAYLENDKACVGCGVCVSGCPVNAVKLEAIPSQLTNDAKHVIELVSP